MQRRIIDIHCPTCGAPANFDIIQQRYQCDYCGSHVKISESIKEKQGFRKLQKDKLNADVKKLKLFTASCTGCGAEVVFEEDEALANCAFCGRNLVRTTYLNAKAMPEIVIPFGITASEAQERMSAWCHAHMKKSEARKLLPLIPEMRAFYLPYELIRGPVHMSVSRKSGGSTYYCEGFMENEFVNCSQQLDNLLLDGMEPYDLSGVTTFDFGYVAGHHVKVPDVSMKDVTKRAEKEAGQVYKPFLSKTMETKALDIVTDVSSAIHMPVLLPVYYICQNELMAAVNGQTGKVSVRAIKDSHYYFLPWWLKAIIATIVFATIVLGAFMLFGMDFISSLLITLCLTLIYMIVTLCLYSDTTKNKFRIIKDRKIFTSGEKTFHRVDGELVINESILQRQCVKPVFFTKIEGHYQPVELKFTSFLRAMKIASLCFTVIFLPVILALIINGFNFSKLNIRASAIWFCITVPTVPIYLLKYGIVSLYDRPWIYPITEDDHKRRYKKRVEFKITKKRMKMIFHEYFIEPPMCLAVWFAIITFTMTVYLTAFGG